MFVVPCVIGNEKVDTVTGCVHGGTGASTWNIAEQPENGANTRTLSIRQSRISHVD